ncbi:uncharacterized protein LOC134723665 [Mytilus trossulus]|uniref:uncharacterized protein LOC134723665 n=1 Tax=Mytilus trossulus TaxID=6551 RepID=UPI003007083B
MIMAHILNCILVVLIIGTSIVNAGVTATLPGGSNSYAKDAVVQYNQILVPDANYNAGKYKATVAGNYLVSVTMMSGTVAAHTTLRKNGPIYVWLYTGNRYDMATQTVCMQLAVDDEIWVQMTNAASILFDVYNTFTVVKLP